jgi:carboxymethylenebutenolidase
MTDKPSISQAMIDLYDRFTHDGDMSRRDLMAGLARLAGGAAAAATLLPLIAARADAASATDPADPRLRFDTMRYPGPRGPLMAYMAAPREGMTRAMKVLVIHENRGLNDHIRDVTRRLALDGFIAMAPDFLSGLGETPRSSNGTQSAEDIARQMIASLDRDAAVADGLASLAMLDAWEKGRDARPGAVGFCWGGGMVNALAIAAGPKLRAASVYYGPSPTDSAGAAKVKARMQFHFAGLDDRVNATAPAWLTALRAAGAKTEDWRYEGVNHAFNNDTSAARGRTLAWLS